MKLSVTKLGATKYNLKGEAVDYTARAKKDIIVKLVEITEMNLDDIKAFMKTVVEENVAYELTIGTPSVETNQDVKTLTDLEKNLLTEMQNDCFWENDVDSVLWICTFLDERNLDPKTYRGVISSLVKKGIVETWNTEDGEAEYQVIALTDFGKDLYTSDFLKDDNKPLPPVFVDPVDSVDPVVSAHIEAIDNGEEVEVPADFDAKKIVFTDIKVVEAKKPEPTPVVEEVKPVTNSKAVKLTKAELEVLMTSQFSVLKEGFKKNFEEFFGKKPDMRTVSCLLIGLRKKGLVQDGGFKTTQDGLSFLAELGVTGDTTQLKDIADKFQPTRVSATESGTTPIKDKELYFKTLKENNVAWEEHSHPAINIMRARMAAKKAGFDFTC